MLRINQDVSDNVKISNSTTQSPVGKSYLLNEPIKDEVSFSANTQKPKKIK